MGFEAESTVEVREQLWLWQQARGATEHGESRVSKQR